MEKRYKQPLITAVTLDIEQAILQVCKIGGAYFVVGGTHVFCLTGQTGRDICDTDVRGKAYSANNFTGWQQNIGGS